MPEAGSVTREGSRLAGSGWSWRGRAGYVGAGVGGDLFAEDYQAVDRSARRVAGDEGKCGGFVLRTQDAEVGWRHYLFAIDAVDVAFALIMQDENVAGF